MDFIGVASPYVGRRYKRRLIVDEEKVTNFSLHLPNNFCCLLNVNHYPV